ncbi:uncharacterized protein [Nicotiana sylvestris]|uniref:uncharacterized protein n=1 Tax=Nicotiana sylvestris TaxID=4096 RepID=UPI00388C9139
MLSIEIRWPHLRCSFLEECSDNNLISHDLFSQAVKQKKNVSLALIPIEKMTNDNRNQTVLMVTANASASRTTPALASAEKLENFSGIDFKWWQQKMFFYLTTLSLQKFIKEDVPVLPDETPENERFLMTEAWKHSDFLCKNYILRGLEDSLYNVYSNMETSKELWVALERKYKTKDELQVVIQDLLAEGISRINIDVESINFIIFTNKIFIEGLVINETFQVAAMIEKLPHLWKDFKNYLKHKRKEMLLEYLIVRLRIKEDKKAAEKKGCENSTIMGANILEDIPQNNRKKKKDSGPKNNTRKKRFNGNSYNCGKSWTQIYRLSCSK